MRRVSGFPTPIAISRVVAGAQKAFRIWSLVPAPRRADFFYRLADRIDFRAKAFALQITLETGKTITESRAEVRELTDTIRYYAGEGRRLYGITSPSELSDKACFTVRRPLGVCVAITPWNFPLAVAGWKLFAALIVGNSVVWKPSEKAPRCAQMLLLEIKRSGFSKDVVQILEGEPGAWLDGLICAGEVRAVSFTGSTASGRAISAKCALSGKKCSLELGGKNVQIIFPDADLRLAVDGAIWGAFGSAGQRCTSTSRLLVHRGVIKKVIPMLVKRIRKIKIGDPKKPDTQLGPLISGQALERVERMVRKAVSDGAVIEAGGSADLMRNRRGRWKYYRPTLLVGVTAGMDIFQKEVFGPVLSVVPFGSLEEAIDLANNSEYGLSSSVYTRSMTTALQMIAGLDVGITYLNSPTIGAEVHLPFGGTKATGSGREAGREGLDAFSEWQTVYMDWSGRLQKAQSGDGVG